MNDFGALAFIAHQARRLFRALFVRTLGDTKIVAKLRQHQRAGAANAGIGCGHNGYFGLDVVIIVSSGCRVK